ncbi:ferritin-like domain-containing protein [Actinomadura sp. KC216]|uniref:ferritin-like domain-containing protein n=1 Tax=Actinomadura sp. KC216 TaxID=2530370 RepID=UPI0014044842|nr:ferritin-like domain-containing protein [Actinomadura sp. KC216]
MGTAGIQLVRGIDPADLADDLDRLYCYEQVTVAWARALDNRLTGLAEIMLEEPAREHAALAERHAGRLAARIAQLGGAITADPTRFAERAQVDGIDLPGEVGDLAPLSYALVQEQKIIGRYGQLIDRVRGADDVTERLLVSILSAKVAQEDELESGVAAGQSTV